MTARAKGLPGCPRCGGDGAVVRPLPGTSDDLVSVPCPCTRLGAPFIGEMRSAVAEGRATFETVDMWPVPVEPTREQREALDAAREARRAGEGSP